MCLTEGEKGREGMEVEKDREIDGNCSEKDREGQLGK